jgi:hypothetical protein
MNSKKKKILLAITMITLWIITAESTTVSTRPNNEPATPAALPTQEPHSQKPTTTTTSNPPPPTTTTPRHRQIPPTINEEPTRTTMITTTVEQDIKALICSYPWPCHEALQVAECESNFKPHAISPPNRNGTRDYGLMQINNGAWGKPVFGARWDNVLDAKTNLQMAWHIYQTANNTWQPWTCRP